MVASEGPVTSSISISSIVSGSPSTISATVSDATTSGSNIVAAEYFIDSLGAQGTGTAMTAVGGFNQVTETVTATLSASLLDSLSPGTHILYVRGEDANGYWGVATKYYFTVP